MNVSRLKITRKFTNADVDVYSSIDFIERLSEVREESGHSKSSRTVIAPSNWSQIAVDIIAQKYMRRSGVPVFLIKIAEPLTPEWLWRSEINPMTSNVCKGESDVREVVNRVVGAWTYYGWNGNYFESEEDAKAYYDEMRYMMIHQIGEPNSPQMFNTGIYWAYGIKGSSNGHYYVNPNTKIVEKTSSSYERPQAHACFILSVEDNLVEHNGIMDLLSREARVFKFGSGVGTNFSTIRGKGEKLSSGGISSGLMSFLKIGDAAGGAIKSGGTTRRAAKMLVLNVDHPEILEYINWKVKEEDKVISLITGSEIVQKFLTMIKHACQNSNIDNKYDIEENHQLAEAVFYAYHNHVPIQYIARVLAMLSQGIKEIDWEIFNTKYDGEAYSSISGQNSNNSVRITNQFMNAVLNDEDFVLTNRTDGKEFSKIKARYLWHAICKAAWTCADPGLQFHNTINDWNTCPEEEIVASNPCSEYNFHNNTSCNLASLNLDKFRMKNNDFDADLFIDACKLWTITLEISVYMSQYPSKEVAEKTYKFRTLGLGYANLGTFLMNIGLSYSSAKGRAIAAYITALMQGAALECSADMAQYFGTFDGYLNNVNKEGMLKVINNHYNTIMNQPCIDVSIQPVMLDKQYLTEEQFDCLKNLWDSALNKGYQHGFRNAQHTVLAPTGTIGLLMDCGTTGIEPQYALVAWKKLQGGGYLKIINQSIPIALSNLGYSLEEIEAIIQYIIGTGNIDNAPIINRQMLIEKGFLNEEVDRINAHLPYAWSASSAFSEYIVGDRIYKKLNCNPSDSILSQLGFTNDQIKTMDLYLCGYKCIEGAPFLREEHLPIFDCANKNGEHGQRFISGQGHIDMMASTQPYLSGAISKTVNIPENESIQAFEDLLMHAYKKGLKAVAFFRDQSKLSSALSTGSANGLLATIKKLEQAKLQSNTKSNAPTSCSDYKSNNILKRGEREIMPNRRKGYTQKVKIGDTQYKFYYTIGYNDADEIREVFITGGGKEGTAFRSLLGCFAQSMSLGLQYGIPLEKYIESFEYSTFKPSGIVIGDKDVPSANSIIDYLMKAFRKILRKQNESGANIGEHHSNIKHNFEDVMDFNEDSINNESSIDEAQESFTANTNNAYSIKYTGEFCSRCGSYKLIKTGKCSTCQECGENNGCG